ncbi:MAG: hypothetical protein L3K52_18010 [Candidatus Thiothrix sulfatifontis]|nr:MAG: hypothetical protein L3K52_18010 [Candidatus Thiothrix sulfatifontis]
MLNLTTAAIGTSNGIAGIAAGLNILSNERTTTQITGTATAAAVDAVVAVFNSSTGNGELWYDDNWSTLTGRKQIATLDNMDSAAELNGVSALNGVDFSII